jgi:hypothetical protein
VAHALGILSISAVAGYLSRKLLILPLVVTRPIELLPPLVNQSARSGPTVISVGAAMVGSRKLLIVPLVLIRPIEPFPPLLVNQSAPSGPTAIPSGLTTLAAWKRLILQRLQRPEDRVPLAGGSTAVAHPPLLSRPARAGQRADVHGDGNRRRG